MVGHFLNIPNKNMIDSWETWVWGTVTGRSGLNLTFSNKLLIETCKSNSKSVSHISDRYFKCLSLSAISTDNSNCVAKFRFASVFKVESFVCLGSISCRHAVWTDWNCPKSRQLTGYVISLSSGQDTERFFRSLRVRITGNTMAKINKVKEKSGPEDYKWI